MGGKESKGTSKDLDLFDGDEKEILMDHFTSLSGSSTNKKMDRIVMENTIKNFFAFPANWNTFTQRICDVMTEQSNTAVITFDGYVHSAALLIKGLVEEKAVVLLYLATGKRNQNAAYEDCTQLCKIIIKSSLETFKKSVAVNSWSKSCLSSKESNEESIQRLVIALTKELQEIKSKDQVANEFDVQTISNWLLRSPLFNEFFDMFSHQIYRLPITQAKKIVPLSRNVPDQVYSPWLTMADIMYVNSNLPTETRDEWRFLFSSSIHGESFSSLMGKIIDKGPTVLLIKDTDGYVFGGFASDSWMVRPQFAGTNKNFVFSLTPTMDVFHSTGFNDHYQYLNIQQQTFPNGLGMGGQLDYFAIWLDAEYGKGKCSPSCTTYNCRQLSCKSEFDLDRVEVWAVGPEPIEDDEDEGARPSILDVDVEGTAMLRMLNRGPVSEGMRENPTAGEPEEKELYTPKSE